MSKIPMVPLDLAEPKAVVEAIRQRRGGQLSNLDRVPFTRSTAFRASAPWNVAPTNGGSTFFASARRRP